MNTNERGTLYWMNRFPSKNGEKEPMILIKASNTVGTLEDLITELNRPEYELELDDRFSMEVRLGKPGHVIIGHMTAEIECAHHEKRKTRQKLIAVFIPEDEEETVISQLAKDIYSPVVMIPFDLQALAEKFPSAQDG